MSIKKLGGDFAFYGLIDVVQRSLSLILVPFFTRVLDINEFGNLDIFLVLMSIFSVLIDFQFISGISRLYLEYLSKGLGSKFAGTVVFFRFYIGIALAILFSILGFLGFLEIGFMPSFLNNKLAWLLILIFVPFSISFEALMTQARMLRLKVPFASGAVVSSIVTLGGSIITTGAFDWGITGIILSMLVGKIIGGLIVYFGLGNNIQVCVDKQILNPLLMYCMPLIPGWWLGFSATYVSRFFVFDTLGPGDTALLAISMKLQSLIGIFAISFRSAWLPLAMTLIEDKGGDSFYIRSTRLFISGGFLVTFLLTLFINPILTIIAPSSYQDVGLTFALFSLGCIIGEVESNLQLGCQLAKKTIWITFGSMFSFLISIFILYTYTSQMGIRAAGLALFLSSFGRIILTYFSSQYYRYISYDNKSFLMFGFGCLVLLFNVQLNELLSIPVLYWRGILLLFGLYIFFSILSKSEIQAIRKSIQSINFKTNSIT
jgi:O-antigen/teichoic acid export membrane protein